jgi:hypothetical protein
MDASIEIIRDRMSQSDNSGKRLHDARKMLEVFQKLKEQHGRTGNTEEEAEALFIERKIQEYREDLNRISPCRTAGGEN